MAVEIANTLVALGTVTPFVNPTIQFGWGLMPAGVQNGVGDIDVAFDPAYVNFDNTGTPTPGFSFLIPVITGSVGNVPPALWVNMGAGASPNSRRILFFDDAGAPVDVTTLQIAVYLPPLSGYFF